jgi:hypothetical protein
MIWVFVALYLVVASALWATDRSWTTALMALFWPAFVVIAILGLELE